MANAIAESLLALLAGAAPAYAEAKSRRGQENRETQKTLLGEERATEEKQYRRRQRATEFAAEEGYRSRVLEGQEADRAAGTKLKEKELGIREREIANQNEFENLRAQHEVDLKNLAQDKQNAVAILQKQIEGYQTLLTLARAGASSAGKDGKAPKTPEEQLRDFRTKAVLDILGDESGPASANARLAILFGDPKMTPEDVAANVKNMFGAPEGGGSLDELLGLAEQLAGGASLGTGGIEPLGAYPRSGLSGFSGDTTSSEFEFNQRYNTNPRLQVLTP